MPSEIEKKFILARIPAAIERIDEKEIHQTYLATGTEEVRVRKLIKQDVISHTMTVKKGSGLTREEVEIDISPETYTQLLESGNRKPLIKKRIRLKVKGYAVDVDVYLNAIDSRLITCEIEFESEEEAHAFQKPKWFGEDVTEDKQYKNQSLWKRIQ